MSFKEMGGVISSLPKEGISYMQVVLVAAY